MLNNLLKNIKLNSIDIWNIFYMVWIMQLNLITLATVKTQLGIGDTTYDSAITAMIPIVSNDVRRILNTNYDTYILATITNSSTDVTIGGDDFNDYIQRPLFNMGQVISGTGIPDDTYFTNYDPDTATYTISQSATAAGTYFYPTIQISQWPAISKMIFYKVTKQSTDSATERLYSSITYGNVSKSFGDQQINSQYDYPQVILNDLGKPFARVG